MSIECFQIERTPTRVVTAEVVYTDGRRFDLPTFIAECAHSLDGFEFGYGGSGPSQLAYAICRYMVEAEPDLMPKAIHNYAAVAWRYHQEFKWQQVSRWESDIVTLGADVVRLSLQKMRAESDREDGVMTGEPSAPPT